LRNRGLPKGPAIFICRIYEKAIYKFLLVRVWKKKSNKLDQERNPFATGRDLKKQSLTYAVGSDKRRSMYR
jgi:hypothetical protein